MSDGSRMGWYGSSMVRGVQEFKVDFKADINLSIYLTGEDCWTSGGG